MKVPSSSLGVTTTLSYSSMVEHETDTFAVRGSNPLKTTIKNKWGRMYQGLGDVDLQSTCGEFNSHRLHISEWCFPLFLNLFNVTMGTYSSISQRKRSFMT